MEIMKWLALKKKCSGCEHKGKEQDGYGEGEVYFPGDVVPRYARCNHPDAPEQNSVQRKRPYWCPKEPHNKEPS